MRIPNMLALVGGLFLGTIAHADIINVPGDFSTIQAAIVNSSDGDEIIVAPGTYNENINLLSKAITVRSTDPADPAVVVSTIIDGGGSGSVVTCNTNEGPNTVINGFTITGGNAFNGGGMYTFDSSPTVTNCTFSENTVSSRGGGMYNESSSPLFGSPTVTDCTFSANSATENGGGMYNFHSSPTVSNCTFNGNAAISGGGMYNESSSPAVTKCRFSGNTASEDGGGMYNVKSSPSVTNGTFSGNSAVGRGSGMLNVFSSPTVTNCTFSGNSDGKVVGGGGGMWNFESSPTVTNCTFSGNSANRGGGMYNESSSSPAVTNCTFSGNSAGSGGGMFNFNTSSPTVTNCTFSGNDADNGRALAFDSVQQHLPSELSMTNCILWDGGGEVWINDNTMINIAYSDVQGGWPGEGNINADPLFVDPGFWDDNGTPKYPYDDLWVEGDYHFLPGSPCIDAGDKTAVPEGIVTDLDGNPRFLDDPDTPDTGAGGCLPVDMGAYEYQEGSSNCPCQADLDGDGQVRVPDLIIQLAAWGPNPDHAADFTGDGFVNLFDLIILLDAWGKCPK